MSRMLLLLSLYFLFSAGKAQPRTNRCIGTRSKFSHSENPIVRLSQLRQRYTNCTVVEGNLEIVAITQSADLTFLKTIQVVTGYVLIAFNDVSYIPLTNLKIIQGQELYNGDKSLYIVLNSNTQEPSRGLETIGLGSLTEIQRGNVYVAKNKYLCYVNTIDWLDMINVNEGWRASVTIDNGRMPNCSTCHASCNGHCWGPSASDCQTRTKSICHKRCQGSRCRGPRADQCCHQECASGCTGATNADCMLCRNVNSSGSCVDNCPSRYKFNFTQSAWVRNPDGKYNYGGYCVDACPDNFIIQDGTCVRYCRAGSHNNGAGECVSGAPDASRKECFGIGNPDGPLAKHETVDSKNIGYFEGCITVKGNIVFQAYAFTGDIHSGTPSLTKEQVIKSLSSIKVITGYLQIMSWSAGLRDFSAFANLRTIRGDVPFRAIAALVIQDSTISSGPFQLAGVQSLGFRSLESIDFGNVYIGYMRSLCFVDTVNWTSILKNPISRVNFQHGLLLRRNKECSSTCHASCNGHCWGPTSKDCQTSPGSHDNETEERAPCVGDSCDKGTISESPSGRPTECFGVGNPDGPLATHETIDSTNIGYFEGCNTVKGSIVFQSYSFVGDPHSNTSPLTMEKLKKSFSSVKVITGFLQILSWPDQSRDFSAFANLKTIRGVELFRSIAALVIQDSTISAGPFHLRGVQSLGFRSLESIEYGNVYIGFMRGLCYADKVNWTRILKNPIRRINFEGGVLLRNNKICKNQRCHTSCDANGCWGPEDRDCLNCRHYSQNGRCVTQCEDGFYQSGKECLPCDSACEFCTGSDNADCIRCKPNYYLVNGVCSTSCPGQMCPEIFLRRCMPCGDRLQRIVKEESPIQ